MDSKFTYTMKITVDVPKTLSFPFPDKKWNGFATVIGYPILVKEISSSSAIVAANTGNQTAIDIGRYCGQWPIVTDTDNPTGHDHRQPSLPFSVWADFVAHRCTISRLPNFGTLFLPLPGSWKLAVFCFLPFSSRDSFVLVKKQTTHESNRVG